MGLLDKLLEKLLDVSEESGDFLRKLRGCKDDQLVAEEPC